MKTKTLNKTVHPLWIKENGIHYLAYSKSKVQWFTSRDGVTWTKGRKPKINQSK
jgi:hypothetical protein